MFAAELRRAREARRMSQSQLALDADFDHSYVSRLESGTRTPTIAAAARLADVLELSEVERVRFLACAGYVEEVALWMALAGEPLLMAIARYLTNPASPLPATNAVRQQLAGIVDLLPEPIRWDGQAA